MKPYYIDFYLLDTAGYGYQVFLCCRLCLDEGTRPGEVTSPRPPTGARMDGSDVLLTFSMATVSPVKWMNRHGIGYEESGSCLNMVTLRSI